MNKDQRLILFAHARTGSTSLMHLLNLHSDIRMCHEPFHPSHSSWYKGEENFVDHVKDASSLDAQMSKIFQRYNGIKTLSYQLPVNLYERLLARDDTKTIFLSRRNNLQASVSAFIAGQTNVWQRTDLEKIRGNQIAALEPVPLNELRKTLKYFRELDSVYRQLISRKPPHAALQIYYEDVFPADLERNREALRNVFRFVGLDLPRNENVDKLLDPGQTKVTSSDVYRSIPNAALIDRELGSDETGWLIARGA